MMLKIHFVIYVVLTKLVSMNQRQSQNISHVSVDVNLMVGHVTRGTNGTMVNFSVSVKKPPKTSNMRIFLCVESYFIYLWVS